MSLNQNVLMLVFVAIMMSIIPSGIGNSDDVYSKDVIQLTAKKFDNRVLKSDSVWVVVFYAPWCPPCQRLKPEFVKAAKALRGVVNVAAVRSDEKTSFRNKYGIKTFPTIKIFGGDKSNPELYSRPRTAADIVDAALEAVSQKVRGILDKEEESKIECQPGRIG